MMNRKRVYLTIDDAPTKDFLYKVNYLYDRDIPAIFFCIGDELQKYESQVVEAIGKGFVIGNHSMRHNYFSDMSYDECTKSIQTTDIIIERLYKKAGVERSIKVFRFPHFDQGGDEDSKAYEGKWSKPQNEWTIYPNEEKRLKLQEYLKFIGYKQPKFEGINFEYFHEKDMLDYIDVRFTYDQMEYFLGVKNAPYGLCDADAILHRVDEDVPRMGRSLNRFDTSDIILIHDQNKTTGLFYKIIDKYLSKNFEFLDIPR